MRAYTKAWQARNREKVRAYHRKTYLARRWWWKPSRISKVQFDALLAKQGGLCAICRQPETYIRRGHVRALSLDHDHVTGQTRGLLCNACNTGIGRFADDPKRLQAAARYLRRYTVQGLLTVEEYAT